MAVTSVRITTDRAGRVAARQQRSYTITYLIETDDKQDGPLTVSDAVPQIGDIYQSQSEIDLSARVSAVEIRSVEGDPNKWRAEIEYTRTQNEDPNDPEAENPGDREPTYSVRFEKSEVPVQGPYSAADPSEQSTSTAIANSAGQPYNPPITREETRPVIVIQDIDAALDLPGIAYIQDSINASAFAGFAAQTLKLNVTQAAEYFEAGQRWWRKTYELSSKRAGWVARPLDYGTITDEDGNVRETLLLNSSPTTGAPQYRGPYTLYRELDFATDPNIPQVVKDMTQAPN